MITAALWLALAMMQHGHAMAMNMWDDDAGSLPMTCKADPLGHEVAWRCMISPEPMDVPAIQVGSHLGCENTSSYYACLDHQVADYSCADKSRVLLTDEQGGKHCVKF